MELEERENENPLFKMYSSINFQHRIPTIHIGGKENEPFLVVGNGGNVGIGTIEPTEKLEVTGTIKDTKFKNDNFEVGADGYLFVRELIVQANNDFVHPDYVFEPNYKPIPLKELETFIKANKHLPNIPTEQEIKENGLDLGSMQKLQMQKIEELTLYIIELNKQNGKLQERIFKLENK